MTAVKYVRWYRIASAPKAGQGGGQWWSGWVVGLVGPAALRSGHRAQ